MGKRDKVGLNDKVNRLDKATADGFRIVSKRLKALENKVGRKANPEPTKCMVFMYEDGTTYCQKDTSRPVKPRWIPAGYGNNLGLGFFRGFRENSVPSHIPGLQKGMLCEAVEDGDTYKITKVLECNMDIDVDWRTCPFFHRSSPVHHRKCLLRTECDFAWRLSNDGRCVIPYLPDTDIQIDCDFKEKKKPNDTTIQKGYYNFSFAAKCSNCGQPISASFKRSIPESKPKLITLEVLKARGVSCNWALDLFKYSFPSGGCTVLKLLKSVYGKAVYQQEILPYPLNWTQEQKDQAMWFILQNLWDYA